MPKKSSIMAKLNEAITSLTGMVEEAQKEMAGYMEDAEKYRELKPMLNKITNRISQETTAPLIIEETTGQQTTAQPGDLCIKCAVKPSDNGCQHDAQEHCGAFISIKPIRRKKADATNTNTDPPKG